jgi:alpha-D-xyloside xylohydrolase
MTLSVVTALIGWSLDGAILRLRLAEQAATRSVTGGWLTAAADGVEASLPNLPPALPVPAGTDAVREVELSVVADGVVRVRTGPDLPPLGILVAEPVPLPVDVLDVGDGLVLQGPGVAVRVRARPFGLTVLDGDVRTAVRTAEHVRQTDGLPLAPALRFAGAEPVVSFALDGAPVHGFGEQFAAFDLRGRSLTLRVADAMGTATGLAYKPAPVWHAGSLLGFLHTGAVVRADIGQGVPDALTLQVHDATLDLFLVAHRDPAERLARYTALTGRAPAVPDWSLGFWLGRCRYRTAAEMLAVADRLRAEGIPADVLHCDPDWLRVDRLNCDFDWNTERFGRPEEFVAALAQRGLRLSLWELPYLDPASPRHAEALAAGHLVVDAGGEPVAVEGTPTPDGRPRALVDLGSPQAREWWQKLHEPLLDAGVAVFKADFGEGLPDGAALTGVPPAHAHNLYPLRYHAAVAELSGLIWARAGWAGSQRYPTGWAGDGAATADGMRATLRGGLNAAMSIPGWWSHDIGGFSAGRETGALYVRWLQFGAFSPMMRAHGLHPREPWAFGPRVLDIARRFIRLRYALRPYLRRAGAEATARGMPVLRPLALGFPDDPDAAAVDDAFLLGPDLLVVPVFSESSGPVRRSYHLPAGEWTDLLTGVTRTGPARVTEDVALERIPVLVRAGADLETADLEMIE